LKSPYASPFFFIKKKDGKLCLVQDYWKLNALTIKNRYPLPLIPEIIDKVQDTRLFTKLDVQWGYNDVQIQDGDKWKAAFKMNQGLYEPRVMFFGLTNSPTLHTKQSFQSNKTLRKLCGVLATYQGLFFQKTSKKEFKFDLGWHDRKKTL